jgi:hypothetical protein
VLLLPLLLLFLLRPQISASQSSSGGRVKGEEDDEVCDGGCWGVEGGVLGVLMTGASAAR